MNFFWSLLTQNNTVFTKVITGLFFIIGLPAILHHAMWRDELNVWLIVRDSGSLMELFYNIHKGLFMMSDIICTLLQNGLLSKIFIKLPINLGQI
ncbi:hypothetical protein NIES932_17790 [Raphidiopsis curvata NIES-932]|nr:hypothetical protein NIES932_17790 [Raphidiopsis curvata NIES-932]